MASNGGHPRTGRSTLSFVWARYGRHARIQKRERRRRKELQVLEQSSALVAPVAGDDGLHLVEPELRRHAADVGERHFRPRIPTGIAGRSSSVLPHPPRVAQRHDQCMLLAPRQQ